MSRLAHLLETVTITAMNIDAHVWISVYVDSESFGCSPGVVELDHMAGLVGGVSILASIMAAEVPIPTTVYVLFSPRPHQLWIAICFLD